MKRILILGVNGFIGHHLSKRILADTDWEIHGMDMQDDRIQDLLSNPRFHFLKAISPLIGSGLNIRSKNAMSHCH